MTDRKEPRRDADERLQRALSELDSAVTSNGEVEELRRLLTGLARGELAVASRPSGPLGEAVSAAMRSLAERLRPLARGLCSVAGAARRDVDPSDLGRELAEEATVSLDLAEVSLEELGHLTDRVGDVATQASVVALDVAIELERDGELSQEAMADFAGEVRRLADRTDVATRRLPVVIGRLRAAHGKLRSQVEALEHHASSWSSGSVRRGVLELESMLHEMLDLGDERGTARSRERVASLRRELAAELVVLSHRGVPPTAELEEELTSIAELVGAALAGDEDR